jgi:hypothetical protein
METEPYKVIEKKGVRLTIMYDEFCTSPRENDNLGTFVMWHRRYSYGDEHPKSKTPEEYLEELKEEGKFEMLPVYMFDHSGIAFNTGGFNCPWDSGQVGFIYITHEKIKEEFGNTSEETIERVLKLLEAEIKELDLYARGSCYGFKLETSETCDKCDHKEWTETDGCWGFITEKPEQAILEQLDKEYRELFKEDLK